MPELLLPQMFDRFRNAKGPQEALQAGAALLLFLYAMQGEGLSTEVQKLINPLTSYIETAVSHLGESPERIRAVYEAQSRSAAKSDLGWLKDFDESLHPRDERGRFTVAGGGADKQLELPIAKQMQPSIWSKAERELKATKMKLLRVNDLGRNVRDELAARDHGVSPPSKITDDHLLAARGFSEGIKAIKDAGFDTTDLAKRFPVIFAELDPPDAVMSTSGTSDGSARFFINTIPFPSDFTDHENLGFSFAWDKGYEVYGETGDQQAALSEMYKWSAVHEMGHAFDMMYGGGMSASAFKALDPTGGLRVILDPADFSREVSKSVGGYALMGGPAETAAELFAKMIAGELPEKFESWEEELRANIKQNR